jgi:multiple sugar transport system permease protein
MSTVVTQVPKPGEPVPADWGPPLPKPRKAPLTAGRVIRYVMLAIISIIFVAPFAYMVITAFEPLSKMFRYPPTWIPSNPTFANFTGFLNSGRPVGRWVGNSLYVSVSVTLLSLFFNSLVGYTFAKRKFPGRDFLFFLGLATLMLPTEVTLIPNYLIMRHIPLFGGNDLYGQGGHGWLDSYWVLIAPNISGPFGIFLMRQYMKSIPDTLIDAARIDGAGHFRIYWKIILPLSLPAIAALGVFTFQTIWGDFYAPLIFINNPNLFTLPLGLALYQQANRTVWNLVIAGSVLLTIPMIILFAIFQKQFIRGISVSSTKG